MKTATTAGICAVLVVPSLTVLAADGVTTNEQSEALRLMTQTRAYVQRENQYRYYAETDPGQQTTQDKTRSMVGADNETGKGELNRERIRHRDGNGTGSLYKYGTTGTGDGQYGAGSGKGGGGGGRR